VAETVSIHQDDSPMETIDKINVLLAGHGLIFEVLDDGKADPVTFELKTI
jgi:hypothetical protein